MENEKFIYVVMGTTGEYSDICEWSVIAYEKEEEAKRHITLATQEARRILAATTPKKHWTSFNRIYDPYAVWLDKSTSYFYYTVKLVITEGN